VSVTGAQVVSDRVLTIPNGLSLLRLLLVPVFAVLALSSLSDYLDGHLARSWGQVTRLGQVLDPFADRLFILTTLLGLAYRGIVPWWLVVVLLARDLTMVVTLPVLARVGHGVLPVHFLGKAGTFCLMYAFPLLLLSRVSETLAAATLAIGWAFAVWGTGLYWWSGLLYLRQVASVVRAERDRSGAGTA